MTQMPTADFSPHIRIEKNTKGRDFVVGDIHGHIDLFHEELSSEGFDPSRDRVFAVGDLIDRGPDSLACLDLLDKPWFYAVRGNHEQMMIEWAKCEGFPNWHAEFGDWLEGLSSSEIFQYVDQLQALPIAITLDGPDYSVGICHAEPCGFDWGKMISDPSCFQQMMWGRKILKGHEDPKPVEGIDITLHGHTPVLMMRRIGNRYFVDTGAGMGDSLTVRNIAELVKEYRDFQTLF